MSRVEEQGHCVANELDELSLSRPGTELVRACARRVVWLACDDYIEKSQECTAKLRLTVDGITESENGNCMLQVSSGLAKIEFDASANMVSH